MAAKGGAPELVSGDVDDGRALPPAAKAQRARGLSLTYTQDYQLVGVDSYA